MNLRKRQQMMRLQKISESSSPSPKKEGKKEEPVNHRIHPLTSTPILSTITQKSFQDERATRLTSMKEEIMDRKSRLMMWQEVYHKREQHRGNNQILFHSMARGILLLAKQQPQVGFSFLRALRQGKKSILQWLLCWVRQLFWLISLLLTQNHVTKH